MRSLSPFLLGLFAAGAFAQDAAPSPLPPPELSVIEALQRMRDGGIGVALSLDANETHLGRTVRTQSTVKWSNSIESGREVVRAEIVVWTDGIRRQRVVSDGRTVWSYDYRRNSYSALPVDRTTGAQANTYRLNIEGALSEAVGGPTADLVRLAREIAGGGVATHRAWIPGVRPVPGKKAWQGRWAIYDLPTGQPKNVTFEIADDEGEAWFTRVRRTGSTKVGREWRTIDETIEPLAEEALPTSAAFIFVPPRNAVSVPARAVRF